MKTVVVSNQKGGVGKSTLTVLLAHWLVDKRRERVAVIDLDHQANASKVLAQFDGGVPAGMLLRPAEVGAGPDDGAQLVLFAATKPLVDVERHRPDVVFPAFRMQVEALTRRFDRVLIDTPPSLGIRMGAALYAAEGVVCPIELEEFSLDGVTDMLKTVYGMRQKHNPSLRLAGLIANRFNPHSLRQKHALADLINGYAEFVVPARISTRSAIPEALAAGVPVWRLSKTSAREAAAEVCRAFELLWERVESKGDAVAPLQEA